jgi:hypothetical protein
MRAPVDAEKWALEWAVRFFRGCGDTLKADGSSHHFDKLVHNILIGLNDGTYPGERMVPEQMKWFYGELVNPARPDQFRTPSFVLISPPILISSVRSCGVKGSHR